MLVSWWWRFDWRFARLMAPVVTTTSIILCCNERERERESSRNKAFLEHTLKVGNVSHCNQPITCFSASSQREIGPIGRFGITMKWIGAWGLSSWNARHCTAFQQHTKLTLSDDIFITLSVHDLLTTQWSPSLPSPAAERPPENQLGLCTGGFTRLVLLVIHAVIGGSFNTR